MEQEKKTKTEKNLSSIICTQNEIFLDSVSSHLWALVNFVWFQSDSFSFLIRFLLCIQFFILSFCIDSKKKESSSQQKTINMLPISFSQFQLVLFVIVVALQFLCGTKKRSQSKMISSPGITPRFEGPVHFFPFFSLTRYPSPHHQPYNSPVSHMILPFPSVN